MEKRKVVPDTNILVFALVSKDGNPRKIFELFRKGDITFIESEELLEEFIDVIKRAKFRKIFDWEKSEFVKLVGEISEIVHPNEKLDVIKEDPDDNKVLEAVVKGRADCIVSSGKHLLDLKKFRGIDILNAQDFLVWMRD